MIDKPVCSICGNTNWKLLEYSEKAGINDPYCAKYLKNEEKMIIFDSARYGYYCNVCEKEIDHILTKDEFKNKNRTRLIDKILK